MQINFSSGSTLIMVKSLVVNSYPSIPMHILNRPKFSLSPPANLSTRGQAILGRYPKISQYVPMGKTSTHVKETLKLPEAEPLRVVEGYKKMMHDRAPEATSPANADFKEAASEYFQATKPTKDESYEPGSITEKNDAKQASAAAVVQTPRAPSKRKKKPAKKAKKSQFKIVSKHRK